MLNPSQGWVYRWQIYKPTLPLTLTLTWGPHFSTMLLIVKLMVSQPSSDSPCFGVSFRWRLWRRWPNFARAELWRMRITTQANVQQTKSKGQDFRLGPCKAPCEALVKHFQRPHTTSCHAALPSSRRHPPYLCGVPVGVVQVVQVECIGLVSLGRLNI